MVRRVLRFGLLFFFGSTLSAAVPGFVHLTWDPNWEPFLAGYYVYRLTSDGAYQKLVEEPTPIPEFLDFELETDQDYSYRVSAVGGDGREGSLSDELKIAASMETNVPDDTGSTPVIQAATGQLVILTPQRFGADWTDGGTWTQVSGPTVILISVGEGTASFRAPAGGGDKPLIFRYSVPGQESRSPAAAGHRDVKVVGSPRRVP